MAYFKEKNVINILSSILVYHIFTNLYSGKVICSPNGNLRRNAMNKKKVGKRNRAGMTTCPARDRGRRKRISIRLACKRKKIKSNVVKNQKRAAAGYAARKWVVSSMLNLSWGAPKSSEVAICCSSAPSLKRKMQDCRVVE